jgi:hypothetical protein
MSGTIARKAAGNVFQVLTPTRNYGLGKKVTRGIWDRFPEPSFWEVTRVRPSHDLKHGKVYGRLTFRGACGDELVWRGGCDCHPRFLHAISRFHRQDGSCREAHQRPAQEGLANGRVNAGAGRDRILWPRSLLRSEKEVCENRATYRLYQHRSRYNGAGMLQSPVCAFLGQ